MVPSPQPLLGAQGKGQTLSWSPQSWPDILPPLPGLRRPRCPGLCLWPAGPQGGLGAQDRLSGSKDSSGLVLEVCGLCRGSGSLVLIRKSCPLCLPYHGGRDDPSSSRPNPPLHLGCSPGQRIPFQVYLHPAPPPSQLRPISHCTPAGLRHFSKWVLPCRNL